MDLNLHEASFAEAPEGGAVSGEIEQTPAKTFDEQCAEIVHAIYAEAAHREIFLHILSMLREPAEEEALREHVHALPEMAIAMRTPREYLEILKRVGALDCDEAEIVPDFEALADVESASENDALIPNASEREAPAANRVWRITEAGRAVSETLAADRRLAQLLDDGPEYRASYRAILHACARPRTRVEIDSILQSRPELSNPGVNTAFYLDRLEQCGGLIWDGGWKSTEAGMAFAKQEESKEGE